MEVVLFTISMAISAFLLFWVQPLAAKFFLPILGGSPSVWQICMVFFQGMLLLGYSYAHFISRQFALYKQFLIHMSILLLAVAFLPLFTQWVEPIQSGEDPNIWLLTELLTCVALPFFVISSSAPLLQRWFSQSKHQRADDPYYLYAASNLGSLLALLSFPFILEPLFGNYWQNILWAWGYVIYGGLLILISITMLRKGEQTIQESAKAQIDIKQKLLWVALAFIPSSLLLGVTTAITTDIASTPLFWVIPLALYLLTFILCFNPPSAKLYLVFNRLMPYSLMLFLAYSLLIKNGFYYSIPAISINLFVFTCAAFVCHGRLYQSRPHKGGLTEFYLMIAIGGFLGGIFNSLVAPIIFNGATEYPLILSLACLFILGEKFWPLSNYTVLVPIVTVCSSIVLYFLNIGDFLPLKIYNYLYTFIFTVAILAMFKLKRQPLNLSLQCFALMFVLPMTFQNAYTTLFQYRNFFGVIKIREFADLNLRSFLHGTTLHGIQRIHQQPGQIHQSYYVPLKEIAKSLHNHQHPAHVAVAGLGAGSLACMLKPKDEITFYEIDPDVVKVAEDPNYFSYLKQCKPQNIIVGDARLAIEKAPQHYYDLIVLDAFTSDAVPTHLINLQAIELYLEKLDHYGSLAFNISNRHIDLVPVLGSICNKLQLQCYTKLYISDDVKVAFNSKWVFVTRPHVNVINTLETQGWHRLSKSITSPLWTDDYSNIVSLIR